MSKYSPLTTFLENQSQSIFSITFSEIEQILGFELPKSAGKYPAWWSNNEQNSRHSNSWIHAGWNTEDVSFSKETVWFRRVN